MRRLSAIVLIGLALCDGAVPVFADPLPGTKPLAIDQPLDVIMVDGINRFALREIAESIARRETHWKRDFSSAEAYTQSVAPNRERLKTIIGAVDPRVEARAIELLATNFQSALVARGADYNVMAVRWPVLDGVTAEGLLLDPATPPVARVVALADADWLPEDIAGLGESKSGVSHFARRLVENGCQVLIPTLISRDDTYSGHPDVRYTNQTHREFIYRQAFEMGRHIIGYEAQKVLSAVDQFTLLNGVQERDVPIGVAGVGEGGLLALYSAAIDTRIDAALVSGYFQPREDVWQEPIYRNVWALLREFGDAEIASLIAPRGLVVEGAGCPESAGPPAVRQGRSGGAAPGRIVTPQAGDVLREVKRAQGFFEKLGQSKRLRTVISDGGKGPAGGDGALHEFIEQLGVKQELRGHDDVAQVLRKDFDPAQRQKRQFDELVEFTQKLLRRSARVRDQVWSKADRTSTEKWVKTAASYRDMVYDEMIGRLPAPTIDPNVQTRHLPALDEPEYTAYEVMIDVYPDVIAGGILLLPNDLKSGEKRPVVVCQHGLEGVPVDTISRTVDGFKYYSAFTSDLAKRGFITYAPQNPYRGTDRFRTIQRKSNPLKRSLFSYIIPQHQRTIDFLKSLPGVDPQRIAFYGLSYGGKTAVRVPPMLEEYCLSICSADFNEWVVKNTTVYDGHSYVFTGEYEIFEWNMGHTANYAELSYLMTPRPFMVERGHHDGVAPDEWVAWEFAKVYRHYDVLGLGNRAEIEFFNGPHKINGVATYEFLHRHLKFPKRTVN
jgi:cephalosporin-C deacetylase-like acetyl esterase